MIPRVSFTTPTLNRPDTHKSLYDGFVADRWPKKELLVLDESDQPSPFFSGLRDDRVRYYHAPGKPREGGVTRIGEARNRLTQLAGGDFIFHRDDDDVYAPQYTTMMLGRLGDADLVKLVVWRCEHQGNVFEWDTRRFGGTHYAIRGATVEQVDVDPSEAGSVGPAMQDAFLVGFGWSYGYRRDVALKHPFPIEGTEDIPWVRGLRQAGARMVLVDDLPGIALHTIHVDPNHPEGGSPHFPQRLLGELRQKMVGRASNMTELPRETDIQVEPNVTYQILASVKGKHSVKALIVRAGSWGVTISEARDNVPPSEFGVDKPRDGYRLVQLTARAATGGTLPWRVPAPLSVFDRTHVVRAWREGPAMVGRLPPRVVARVVAR